MHASVNASNPMPRIRPMGAAPVPDADLTHLHSRTGTEIPAIKLTYREIETEDTSPNRSANRCSRDARN